MTSSAFPFTRIALLPIWATDCKRVGHQHARCRASTHRKEAGFISGVIMPYRKRDRPTFTEEVQWSEAAAFATALGRRRLASAPPAARSNRMVFPKSCFLPCPVVLFADFQDKVTHSFPLLQIIRYGLEKAAYDLKQLRVHILSDNLNSFQTLYNYS